ncbi:MAG: ribose-phosphate pyrophosphokinase [Patescibacteria group bacterium]
MTNQISNSKFQKNFFLFSGLANLGLAKKIAKNLKAKLGKIQIEKFADGETYVNICEDIKKKNVAVLQSCSFPANENLMELLIILDAIKRLKPKKILVCFPFYPYRRQEKKTEKGESVTAELVAKLLETAGADRILLLDLHSKIVKKFFKISALEASAFELFAEYFKKKKIKNLSVVAPDLGALNLNKKLAKNLDASLAYIKKSRGRKHDIIAKAKIYGNIKGKNVIMLDDEISTGGTLIKAVKLLKKSGAHDIYIAATHGVLAGKAIKKLAKSPIKEIAITDSIYQPREKRIKKIKILSVAEILAEALKNY